MDAYREIKKHIYIYKIFIKNCIITHMEYRANFFMGVLVACPFLLLKLIYLLVIYRTGITINGYSADEAFLFIATYTFMSGVLMAVFYGNFTRIPEYINSGTLDMFITKPISLQFMVTLRYVNIASAIPNITGGTVMIVMAWNKLGIGADPVKILEYLLALALSTLITYAILLPPSLTAFWTVKSQSINDIIYAMWDFNNMPMYIYKDWIKNLGIFIIPIFVITNFPCMLVLDRMNVFYTVWFIVSPLLFMAITRVIWNIAVKNYTSASS